MQIKKSDMTRMGDAKPIKDIPVLVLIRGLSPPRFARLTQDGYSIQGIFGLFPVNNDDLWADISDLLKP